MPTLQEGGETHSNVYLTQKSWSRRGFASILYRVSFSRNVSHRSFGSFEVLLQNELKYVKTEIVCVLWLFHRLHRASSESTMWLFVWKTGAFGWINNHSSHSFSTQTDVTHFCSAELNIGNQPTPSYPAFLHQTLCWGYYRTNLPSSFIIHAGVTIGQTFHPFPFLFSFCSSAAESCRHACICFVFHTLGDMFMQHAVLWTRRSKSQGETWDVLQATFPTKIRCFIFSLSEVTIGQRENEEADTHFRNRKSIEAFKFSLNAS